ncbi:MAG: STAS/SEC14 domain-containing protein [Planctomycetaceae bacterium]
MLAHELLEDEGTLIVRPSSPLRKADFEALSREIDPYLEKKGKLHGLLVEAESFPGWDDFAAMLAHFRFVRDHHRKIEKVAAASDSGFLKIGPAIARHFVAAEIRRFDYAERNEALAWLRGG